MGCFIFGSGGIGGNGGVPFDQVTMEPQFGLAGKKFIDKNKQLKTGTIQNWNGEKTALNPGEQWDTPDIVPSTAASYIPAGYYIGQDIKIAGMPEGSVSGAQVDSGTFRVTKTAGYISGGTDNYAISGGSPTPYALNHTRATATDVFHVIPADEEAAKATDPDFMQKTFVVSAFAHGSVLSGEFAAFTLMKQAGTWGMLAYKMGDYPKYLTQSSLSVEYVATGYLNVTLLDNTYGRFSTAKYYEGFAYYI